MNLTSLTERPIPPPPQPTTDLSAIRDLESHGFFAMPLLQPGFAVLDAGCGTGSITNGLAERVFPGIVTALDSSTIHLEQARRLSQGREIVNTQFVCASASALPFANETFDLVFAHSLLENLPNPETAMREFYRVTRPGGLMAIASPDWSAFQFTPYPSEVRTAISTYRQLLESSGGHPQAGRHLGDWANRTGWVVISLGEWIEESRHPASSAHPLALHLEANGHSHLAQTLREWALRPETTFHQSWKYAIGLKTEH